LGEHAVIGNNQQPFRIIIKAPDRIQTLGDIIIELINGFTAFRVMQAGHKARGFMQQQIHLVFRGGQFNIIYADFIAGGIRLDSHLRDYVAVDRNTTLADILLSLAA